MVYLGFISEEDKKKKEAQDLLSYGIEKMENPDAPEDSGDRSDQLTAEECEKMANDGYITPGVRIEWMTCRKCGQKREVSVASQAYYTKICGPCRKKNNKKRSVIEL